MWIDDFAPPSTLQEQLKLDFKNVFFDEESQEFAKEHVIDGEPVVVVVDFERLRDRVIKDDIENITLCDLLFFVEEEALGYRPDIEKTITFDGTVYTVKDVRDYMGALEIILSTHAN